MPDNALIGIAGVHHVVSELSRRGLVALPTVKNTAAYDIVALNVEGTWHANIQVKTSSTRSDARWTDILGANLFRSCKRPTVC